jgi:hypothetical protein
MKNIFSILTLALMLNISYGQNFKELANYEFKVVEDYQTEKGKVLACSNYLFDNPVNKNDLNRLVAIQYILKWMEGTPDYTFEIGEKAMSLTKGNNDLLGLYFAAMSKVVLDEKSEEKLTNDQIYNEAEAILVEYCSNANNKMNPSKKIKKIIKNRT